MIELQLLGGVRLGTGLRDADFKAVLAQPRRIALLAYLACARPRGVVSRDTLMGVFWPEQSQGRARHSLNQALYFLRKHLGADVFVTAGRESIGIDANRLHCDVVEFERRLDDGDPEGALALYTGDLLAGVFVADALEFERWLDTERDRLRRRALEAAKTAADRRLERNEALDAVVWLRAALRFEPCDEPLVRRLLELLVALGDRTGARRELDAFRLRLEDEFDLPLPDGLEEILERDPHPAFAAPLALSPPHDPVMVGASASARAAEETHSDRAGRRSRRSGWRGGLWVAAGVTMLVAIGLARVQLRSAAHAEPLTARRVLVAPFTDLTGSPELASLGGVASEWLAQELARTGMVDVLPWSLLARESRTETEPAATADPGMRPAQLAREVGAGTLVTGSYFLRGDSVVLRAMIGDVRTGALLRAVESPAVHRQDRLRAAEMIRRQLAGALAGVLDPRLASWSHAASQPPSFEAYRLFTSGIDAFVEQRMTEADSLFVAAADLDTTFTAPLVWAVRSAWETPNDRRARELIARVERRQAVLAPWDQAMLDYYRSRVATDWNESYRHARRLAEIAPVSEWLLLWVEAAMATLRFEEALAATSRIDYDGGWLRDFPYPRAVPAQLHHLLGDFEAELAAAVLLDETLPGAANQARLRAYAGAGRLAEHGALLERMAAGLEPNPLYGLLGAASGELRTHGRIAAAEVVEQRMHELVDRLTPAGRPLRIPRAYRAAGRFDEARAGFLEVLERGSVPREVVLKDLALTEALAGDSVDALRLLDRAFADQPREAWTADETARILAALGDFDGAVRTIRQARANGGGFYFYMHASIPALAEYPPYQELTRPRR